jgi:7-cyano-7-deazaguanine reductase
MSNPVEAGPLGKVVTYCSEYNPALLFPIARQLKRDELLIKSDSLPFYGKDVWTAYELSWLNAKGKPMVAMAEFEFLANSPNIIESKSFKLYLNSYNNTRFATQADVKAHLEQDLSQASGAKVKVLIRSLDSVMQVLTAPQEAICIDEQDVEIADYQLNPSLLAVQERVVEETLYSHLLKSNCLVTGQPDWATVVIKYRGRRIDPKGLLKYLVSYRNHMEFHEQCVERIFIDIQQRCQPEELTVYARYLRRGGLDINPYRSTHTGFGLMPRLNRQ